MPPPQESGQQQQAPTYFVFSSLPQPIWGRPKFRNNVPRPRGIHDYYNVMWDPRVRRGDPVRKQKATKDMEQCLKKKQDKQKSKKETDSKFGAPGTPPPVEGRRHCELQTEKYLENLEAEVTEFTVKTQTDPLHELPVAPWFTPTKQGEDKGTEILPGELFNFDCEVQPIVETLVGKVVEQSLLECMEEEELLCLQDQQMKYEQRRREEQVRLKRLEEREQKVFAERERLMAEMARHQKVEGDAEERIGAAAFASIYLTRSSSNAVAALRDDGFLNSRSMVDSTYLPWLNPRVTNSISETILARTLLDDVIQYMTIKQVSEYIHLECGEQQSNAETAYTSDVNDE